MEWTRGPVIGRGSAATVSLGRKSGDVFAVKSTELSTSQSLQREQSIVSTLSSPYIVQYKGCDISNENGGVFYNIFLEYMPGGTLSDTTIAAGGFLHESAIRTYTHQILLGLEYLHSNGVAHCDIKGRNILIGQGGAKLADFGCAKRVGSRSSVSGTPMFMAPEVARGEVQGLPSDIWSLGCAVVEMATGEPPWREVSDPVTVLYKIGHSCQVPEVPRFLSEQARDFLEKCLRRNPKERWTAKQLLGHPFLVGDENIASSSSPSSSTSPTSVIDQAFWNQLDEPDCSVSVLHDSPRHGDRLAFLDPTLITVGPSWDPDNEEWVTVRSTKTAGRGYTAGSIWKHSPDLHVSFQLSRATDVTYDVSISTESMICLAV